MWRLDVYGADALPLPLPGRRLLRTEHYRWRWLAIINAWLWVTFMSTPYTTIETELTHDEDGGDGAALAA